MLYSHDLGQLHLRKMKIFKKYRLCQDRAVQDQEFLWCFPLQAVYSDICYDSTRSPSTQSMVHGDNNTVCHASDRTATCCCTRQPRSVQESVMQL